MTASAFQTPTEYMRRIDALRDAIVTTAKASPAIMRDWEYAASHCGFSERATVAQRQTAFREAVVILKGEEYA